MTTLYKRGKTWWLRNGQHRESLDTKNHGLAKLRKNDYEQEKLRPKDSMRLEKAVNDYLSYAERLNKISTYSDKKRILNHFKDSCGNPLLHNVGTEHVEKYLSTREKLSPYRWNTERQSISALFTWARNRNFYRNANPAAVIAKKKEPRGKAAEALTDAQIKKVRMVIKKHREIDEAFQVALNGGLRVQEIENQQWTDIDFDHNGVKIQGHDDGWTPKDYEARFVPLPVQTMRIYKRRLKLKALSPFVFSNANGEKHGKDWVTFMSRAMRRAGIKHGGWHRTRHTYGTAQTENGLDPEALRKIMGISDTKTLLKYVHVSPDYEERVRKKLRQIV